MKRVIEFLRKTGVYFLATMDDDQPRVRPFGTANLYDGKLYIQTGRNKPAGKQIKNNPKVELCAFIDGVTLRITGELAEDNSREAMENMVMEYPSLSRLYGGNMDEIMLLYFTKGTVRFSYFDRKKKEEVFEI